MDYALNRNLPIELVEIIMKDVHKQYMEDLIVEIANNIVWIKTDQGNSFLIGKTQNNPYYVLRVF